MADPDYLIEAYTDTGRAILAWGRFEQRIIIQTWASRDPARKSPFTQGSIEQGFYKRWLEWCRVFSAPDAFRDTVLDLSRFRDDLSHNVSIIHNSDGHYTLGVWRRHLKWKQAWLNWVKKYVHLPLRARPDQPQHESHALYRASHVAGFIDGVFSAQAEATGIVEAWFDALGYKPPSIPPFP